MKRFALATILLLGGCSTYKVDYYDTNFDGRIDRERHYKPGVYDGGNYTLIDADADGTYDLKKYEGFNSPEAISKPVPENKPISVP